MPLENWEICKLYKWRYRGVIPNLRHMIVTDEHELWLYIENLGEQGQRYAFQWEESEESRLRGWVGDFLMLAEKGK